MSRVFIMGVALLMLLLIGGCAKQEYETMMGQKDGEIERFVQNYNPEDVTYRLGVWRVELERGSSTNVVEEGDSVYLNFVAHLFSAGIGAIFDTNIYEVAVERELDLNEDYYTPLKSVVGKRKLIDGLDRGVVGMGEGSRSLIIFTAKYGFGEVQTSIIPKNSTLLYELSLLRVIKN
ncbi:MAG: FKBP-type peptidyl-prolyl cis-trans isomerase [Bacteroidales bacterium]|jgi:hypothetical protein